MGKFVNIDKAPEKLRKGEYVVHAPDFLEETRKAKHKNGASRLTGNHFLRGVAGDIGFALEGESFNPYSEIKVSPYEGREFKNDVELAAIVTEMITNECPRLIQKAIKKSLRARPFGTKVVYFVGPWLLTGPFSEEGYDLIDLKDVDKELGLVKAKINKVAATQTEEDSKV